MLIFQELVPLGNTLVIFNRIDIYGSQFFDITFQRLDLPSHKCEISQVFVPELHGAVVCEFIFLPHIIHLFL